MLYIPNAISFPELLEKKGWSKTMVANHGWKFAFVFTKVLNVSMRRLNNEFHQFHIADWDAVLKNSLVNGKRVRFSKLVMDYLEEWQVLIVARDYLTPRQKPGTTQCQTKVYLKLHDTGMSAGFTRFKVGDGEKSAPAAPQKLPVTLAGIYLRLAEQFPRITIDADAAHQFVDNAVATQMPLPNKKRRYRKSAKNPDGEGHYVQKNRYVDSLLSCHWHMWIDAVEEGECSPCADVNGTGRLYSLFTSTPKPLRNRLLMDSLPLYELDIPNCQPLIFLRLIEGTFFTEFTCRCARLY